MIVDELARIPMSQSLASSLARASGYAEAQLHREVTLEHLLLALTEDPDAAMILAASNIDMARVVTDVSGVLGRIDDRNQPAEASRLVVSADLKRILEAAAAASRGRRREINGAIVLAAIVGDGRAPAAHILRSQGLTFEEAIRVLQRALAQPPAAPQPVPQPAISAPAVPPPLMPHAEASPEAPGQSEAAAHGYAPPPLPPAGAGGAGPLTGVTEDLLASARARVGRSRPTPAPTPPAPPPAPEAGYAPPPLQQPLHRPPDHAAPVSPPAVLPPPPLRDGDAGPHAHDRYTPDYEPAYDDEVAAAAESSEDALAASAPWPPLPGGEGEAEPVVPDPEGATAPALAAPPPARPPVSAPIMTPPAMTPPAMTGPPGMRPDDGLRHEPSSHGPAPFEQPAEASPPPSWMPPPLPRATRSTVPPPLPSGMGRGGAGGSAVPVPGASVAAGAPSPPPLRPITPGATFSSFREPQVPPNPIYPPWPPVESRADERPMPRLDGGAEPELLPPAPSPLARDERSVPQAPPVLPVGAPWASQTPPAPPPAPPLAPMRAPTAPSYAPAPAPELSARHETPDDARADAQPGRIDDAGTMMSRAGADVGVQAGGAPRAGRRGVTGLEIGKLVENIPRSMRVAVPTVVEVRIAKADVRALSEGMSGPGEAYTHEVVVTKAMSVRLRAPEGGFYIEPGAPETQWLENKLGLMSDDYASWRWTVTPRARGRRRLQLVVAARTIAHDGLVAETALPEQVIDVRVATNYGRAARRWAGWLAAAIAGGIVQHFSEPLIAGATKLAKLLAAG